MVKKYCLLFGMFILVGFILHRLIPNWQLNRSAIEIVRYISPTSDCSFAQPFSRWDGNSVPEKKTTYIEAVLAASAESNIPVPEFELWERDHRLYYWFRAQESIKLKDYADSVRWIRMAEAGPLLEALGHTSILAGHSECALIAWSLASEIGYMQPPTGYVNHMLSQGELYQVVDAFERLLEYDTERIEWRLTLAKAYIALGDIAAAQEILAFVLQHGTVEEIEAANKVLSLLR